MNPSDARLPLAGARSEPPLKRLFIVGCQRSGTTWMTYLLFQHPQVAALQQAKLFDYLHFLRRWWHNKSPNSLLRMVEQAEPERSNIEKCLLFPEEGVIELCREFATGVYDRVAASKPGARLVVDQTPENGGLADAILELFPDAYFLHVIRDPRAVYASLKAASSWAGWEWPRQAIDGGRYWRHAVENALAIEPKTARYKAVHYEDLQADGPNKLREIFHWLELETTLSQCQQAVSSCTVGKMRTVEHLPQNFVRRGASEGWRDELRRSDVRMLEHLTGDLMTILGYDRTEPPYRHPPLRIWLQETPEKLILLLHRILPMVPQEMLRRWKGRQLYYPEP